MFWYSRMVYLMNNKEKIARRVAKEFKSGDFVNLGAGIPIMVSDFIPEDVNVILHAENGIVGVCSLRNENDVSPYRFDAGENDCDVILEGCIVDSAESFGLVRGGHLDATVLGAMQVDEKGSLANWLVPGKKMAGMGGAMDLVTGTKNVIIATEHCARDGSPKIVKECTYPLTGYRVVNRIITEIAVIDCCDGELILTEIAEGLSPEDVQSKTEPTLKISENLKTLRV